MDNDITTCKSKRVKMSYPLKNEVNPLLLELILEAVFPYSKGSAENWICLSDLRTVCQMWDKKLVKMIRQDTQMDIMRLIKSYPHGLGWTENEEKDGGYHYDCPYVVAPFENIELTGNCDILRDTRVSRWFQIMGSSVKRLRFTSPLTCYHHIRFLECILKLWCPNLKTLTLNGVVCMYTLVHNSKFVDCSDLICNVKEVIISMEGEGDELQSQFKICQPDLVASYLNYNGAKLILLQDDPAVRALFGVKMLKRLSRDFQEPITQESLDFIKNTTGSDGGVLTQIFKCSVVDKLILLQMSTGQCQDFLTFLNFRETKLRKALKHFEFDNFPLALNSDYLSAFRILYYPLTTIKFGMLFASQIRNSLRDLLASYAETLEHLEFSGNVVLQDWAVEQDEEYIEVRIPLLPKLKTLINGNIFTCRVGGLDFLKRTPSLVKCSLSNPIYHSSIYPLTPAEVFNLLFQASHFEEPHPLKELSLDGKICYNNHLEMMQIWFPHLTKLDLTLDGADVFVDFLRIGKQLKLEDVRISFYANDNEWCNAGIVNYISKLTCLKYLQMIHLPDSPLTLSVKTCEEGFAKAPNLTSLKLTNFGIFADEVERIQTCLSHISCVKFLKAVLQYKPVDVEFSLGINKPFRNTL